MEIERAYKIELNPNNKTRTAFLKAAGVARFAYNWGLDRRKEEYATTGKSSNWMEQHRQLNALKKTHFPWMYEVSKYTAQNALRHLERAYINFFHGRAEYPKFKSKRNGIGSFTLHGAIKVFTNYIQLPRIGKVRVKEKDYIPMNEWTITSATISEKAGRWFVSLTVKKEIEEVQPNIGPIVGLDVGISKLAVVSDGTIIGNPRALIHSEKKKKRLQRSLSRKKNGSKNRLDAKMRLVRWEFRIANIRKDAHHKATTMLTKTKSVIGVESLNVGGMLKNHCLAKSLADAGIGEFLRQLKYKSEWYGSKIVEVDPFFPSTKRCSNCGVIKDEILLSERIYNCENCGFEADRDLNAAINLASVAVSWTETINACERREVHAVRQVLVNEARTKHYLGAVLNG